MNYPFFDKLALNNQDFLLLDSYKACGNKCLDVFIKNSETYDKISSLKNAKKYEEESIYGLRPVIYILDHGYKYNFFTRPSSRSADGIHWCPLNKNIEQFFINNVNLNDNVYKISNICLYFYKLCRILLTDRCDNISSDDISFLNENFSLVKANNNFREFIECTFYKFTDRLLALLEKREYSALFDEYIKYGDY